MLLGSPITVLRWPDLIIARHFAPSSWVHLLGTRLNQKAPLQLKHAMFLLKSGRYALKRVNVQNMRTCVLKKAKRMQYPCNFFADSTALRHVSQEMHHSKNASKQGFVFNSCSLTAFSSTDIMHVSRHPELVHATSSAFCHQTLPQVCDNLRGCRLPHHSVRRWALK